MQFVAGLARPLKAAFLGAMLLSGCNEATDPSGTNGPGGGTPGGGGTGATTATFRVMLTDAPSDQLDRAVSRHSRGLAFCHALLVVFVPGSQGLAFDVLEHHVRHVFVLIHFVESDDVFVV